MAYYTVSHAGGWVGGWGFGTACTPSADWQGLSPHLGQRTLATGRMFESASIARTEERRRQHLHHTTPRRHPSVTPASPLRHSTQVAHYFQNGDMFGETPGSIRPEHMTQQVWDYIFLNG